MLLCVAAKQDIMCSKFPFACDVPQEEELRKGGEAKYAHLAMELHVFIEVTAPIPEAYLRMAHAMEEVKKFLIPVCIQNGLFISYTHSLCSISNISRSEFHN